MKVETNMVGTTQVCGFLLSASKPNFSIEIELDACGGFALLGRIRLAQHDGCAQVFIVLSCCREEYQSESRHLRASPWLPAIAVRHDACVRGCGPVRSRCEGSSIEVEVE